MTNMTINGQDMDQPRLAFLDAGFRPFFLGAGLFSIITIAVWMAIYAGGMAIDLHGVSVFHWHAHEMIYGYTVAVVAGFMLTAIEKWTGVSRVKGIRLAGLVGLWAVPRILLLFGSRFILVAGALDLLFIVLLAVAIAHPIVVSKQWKQLGVLAKLAVLALGQVCFYLGAWGYWAHGTRLGIYIGLYMIVGLILTIARRVVPQFIQRGVNHPVQLFNSRLVDRMALVVFVMFFLAVLLPIDARLAGGLAVVLFLIHTFRLGGWYTHGIWTKPLLWSLFLSIVWIDLGFLLHALSAWGYVSPFVALHAFSYGGIGLVTLSMMSRVSLGHTGRNIHQPPRMVFVALLCLTCGAVVRVFLPMAIPSSHLMWIVISQSLWLASFVMFVAAFFKILTQPDPLHHPEPVVANHGARPLSTSPDA